MSCGDKLKRNCGGKKFSTCIYHESALPDWSELKDEGCVVTAETTDELYKEVTNIKDLLNVADIVSDCNTFTIDSTDVKKLIQSIVDKVEELSCEEATTDGFFKEDIDISKWGLDLSCYVDECNTTIKSLSSLLKEMTKKDCKECIDLDKIAADKSYIDSIPDIIIVDSPNNTVNITIPVDMCKLLKIKPTIDTTININSGTLIITEYKEVIFDGTTLITL